MMNLLIWMITAPLMNLLLVPPTPDVNSPHNIDVSADGTWMTRGYSSKVGVTSVIGQVTGKVLDTEVRSKVCKSCDYWEKRKEQRPDDYQRWLISHPKQCEATHTGSSGAMEAAADVAIFHRSVNLYNLQYTRFTGDGDTNALKTVHSISRG